MLTWVLLRARKVCSDSFLLSHINSSRNWLSRRQEKVNIEQYQKLYTCRGRKRCMSQVQSNKCEVIGRVHSELISDLCFAVSAERCVGGKGLIFRELILL